MSMRHFKSRSFSILETIEGPGKGIETVPCDHIPWRFGKCTSQPRVSAHSIPSESDYQRQLSTQFRLTGVIYFARGDLVPDDTSVNSRQTGKSERLSRLRQAGSEFRSATRICPRCCQEKHRAGKSAAARSPRRHKAGIPVT